MAREHIPNAAKNCLNCTRDTCTGCDNSKLLVVERGTLAMPNWDHYREIRRHAPEEDDRIRRMHTRMYDMGALTSGDGYDVLLGQEDRNPRGIDGSVLQPRTHYEATQYAEAIGINRPTIYPD